MLRKIKTINSMKSLLLTNFISKLEPEYVESLQNKLNELDKINFINCGGCAIVAYAIAKWMNKNYPNIDTEIVYLFESYSDSYINIKNNENGSCKHAVIKIDNKYLDTNRACSLKELKEELSFKNKLTMSNERTLESINYLDHWNWMFKRDPNISKISDILNIDLKEIKIAS